MAHFFPHWPGLPDNVCALTTLRSGGTSAAPFDDGSGQGGFNLGTHVGDDPVHVECNRRQLRLLLPAEPAWLTQVHGNSVINAAEVTEPIQADASFSTISGVVCAVLTADCLPVLLCDSNGTVVAAAHAGWRGLRDGILQNTVASMRASGAGELLAWLGPAIGPRQFEVGAEVRQTYVDADVASTSAFIQIAGKPGKFHADLYRLARRALHTAGVERVVGGGDCTVTQRAAYFSYRRDGRTGRMAALIWLK